MAIPEQLSYMRKYNIGQGAGAPGPVMMQPPSSPASAPAPAPTRTTPNYRAALASLPAGPLQDPVPNTPWRNIGPGMQTSLPREQRQQQPNAVPAVGNVTVSRPADRKLADGTPVFASDAKLNFGAAATPAAAPAKIDPAYQFQRTLSSVDVPMTQTSTGRGGVIENPGDSTANKLQRALTSYSVKGSPSTRAAIAQAILGEAGARQNERMQTLKTQDQAALDAMKLNADAATGNAERRLSADKFNAESQDTREHRRQLLDLERNKPFQMGSVDGAAGILRNDGSYTPVTDASGAPVKFDAPQRGLSQDVVWKSYIDRLNAIDGMTVPEEQRVAAREALHQIPQFAQFAGGGGGAQQLPDKSTFMAELKKRNPTATQQQLDAEWLASGGK